MDDMVKVEKLSFSYKNNKIFDEFNLSIKRGTWVTIIGPNGGGKSTLLKILMGELEHKGTVLVDGKKIEKENPSNFYKKIYILTENPDDKFISETVKEEIAFALENQKKKPSEIKQKVKEIANEVGIVHLLNKNPYHLSGGEKQLVCIAAMLAHDPQVLLMDETLNRIDSEQKEKILLIISRLKKDKNLTIIKTTHNAEEALYSDEIIILDQGEIVLKGETVKVFSEEKILIKLGIEIPFMISLSLKLKYYNLLNDVELDMDKMVDKIWS